MGIESGNNRRDSGSESWILLYSVLHILEYSLLCSIVDQMKKMIGLGHQNKLGG